MRWTRRTLLGLAFCMLALPAAAAPAPSPKCVARARLLETLETLHAFQVSLGLGSSPSARATLRAALSTARQIADRCVALNQVQVLGTHNSYHIEPPERLIRFYASVDPTAIFLQYTHRPLPEQFEELGIRQIELDIFADPDGGLFASPVGYQLLLADPNAHIPELEAPGIKVFHIQDLDWQSRCPIFVDCLEQLRTWSDANPGHLPIAVLVEVKDELESPFATPPPVPFDADRFVELDAEIRSVLPPAKLITPDDVRGGSATLEEAVLTRGWPVLGDARGRFLFLLDNGEPKRSIYRDGHPSLEGRVLFTNAVPGDADAAFVKRNDPVGSFGLIQDLVAAGYIVRTRADADTVEARNNDTGPRDLAIGSGAQYVSSDYPEPDPRWGPYQVSIPDGEPGRCNPVNAPSGCRSHALER